MNPKSDAAYFDTTVAEALARMKQATSAASLYEVHRAGGQLTVRRSWDKADKSFTNVTDYALVADLKPADLKPTG
jgi:hypothetical protein